MVLIIIALLLVTSFSIPSLIFRLDDIQCGWQQNTSFMILDLFLKYHVPLSIGVITGMGDCYSEGLLERYNQSNGTFEIASHSVHHLPMINFNYTTQLAELVESKQKLESFFGNGTVRTFIPPTNVWNYDTIAAMNAAGYDIISGQCTVAQLTYPSFDNMCPVNMYTARPSFFPRIEGVIHMPTGASEADFASTTLITTQQLFSGSDNDCLANSICSVQSQVNHMGPYTEGDSWSVIMMHPQDFPENATFIENFFMPIFQFAKANYNLTTFTGLAGPVGSRVNLTNGNPPVPTATVSTGNPPSSTGSPNSGSQLVTSLSLIGFLVLLAMA